jgi:hypothetical protein
MQPDPWWVLTPDEEACVVYSMNEHGEEPHADIDLEAVETMRFPIRLRFVLARHRIILPI